MTYCFQNLYQNTCILCKVLIKSQVDLANGYLRRFKLPGNWKRKLRIWSHLLNKFVMENFIFCAVIVGASLVASQLHMEATTYQLHLQVRK